MTPVSDQQTEGKPRRPRHAVRPVEEQFVTVTCQSPECGAQFTRYHQPSTPLPKFCSKACANRVNTRKSQTHDKRVAGLGQKRWNGERTPERFALYRDNRRRRELGIRWSTWLLMWKSIGMAYRIDNPFWSERGPHV